MLLERKEFKEENGEIGFLESIYDSSNLLKSTYFPQSNKMYIAFYKGKIYSYQNISQELYDDFEKAESQGVYFRTNISKNEKYPCQAEYSLYPSELNDINEEINEIKNKKEAID